MSNFIKDELTEKVIACSFKVHSELGPGFKEEIYKQALIIAFKEEGIKSNPEKCFDVHFTGIKVGHFRCDFVIEDNVIVEIKSVTGIMPIVFRQQVISYLKASKLKTGLLINFGNKSCEVKRYSL